MAILSRSCGTGLTNKFNLWQFSGGTVRANKFFLFLLSGGAVHAGTVSINNSLFVSGGTIHISNSWQFSGGTVLANKFFLFFPSGVAWIMDLLSILDRKQTFPLKRSLDSDISINLNIC